MRGHGSKGLAFLSILWAFCTLLAFSAWTLGPQTYGLDVKLDRIAFYLILTPLVFTALPLYPLLALVAWRQSRAEFLGRFTSADRLLPLRIQSFAYPLPGFFHLLRNHAELHGVRPTLRLLQRIQLESLQEGPAARAALRLAHSPEWALPFCGEVAVFSNAATTAPLALSGPAGRAVSVLAARADKEEQQPLRLFFAPYPPPESRPLLLPLRSAPATPRSDPEATRVESLRAEPLSERLSYASNTLARCDGYRQVEELRALLGVLTAFAWVTGVQDMERLKIPSEAISRRKGWLLRGWTLLKPFQALVEQLPDYRHYTDPQSRRDFLNRLVDRLAGETWPRHPEFWRNIALVLARHWVTLLRTEAEQAREWLAIAVDIPRQQLRVGQQTLSLRVHNPSGGTARSLRLRVTHTDPGLDCAARELEFKAPLERFQETRIQLPFSCTTPGSCLLRGEVVATDLDGHEARDAFAERLEIGQVGRPYRRQEIAPYVAGEGLGDDRTFVERGDLRHQLTALWRQPGGKPAVLLTGQRRIGKSSLLNKMEHDGLGECKLWPVKLDLQGCNTELGLWQDLAKGMAGRLGTAPPVLREADPFADLKDFLLGLGPRLNGWRFLAMLDEAERIWTRIGGNTADNLRHLMQGHEYPLLVLFCGTPLLKRLGEQYDSALFNTTHPFVLGYMRENESREVLEKPVQGILEYDPVALEEAHRLTRGQPYLLQMLGSVIIQRFDAAVTAGEERGDYVGLRDLQDAADDLVRRDNSAFDQYWKDANAPTKRLYSALAWATDERDRPRLDRIGIARALTELRLGDGGDAALFEQLERLCEEGMLCSEGPTYRFEVPLFRRWLAWRWPPQKVEAYRDGVG